MDRFRPVLQMIQNPGRHRRLIGPARKWLHHGTSSCSVSSRSHSAPRPSSRIRLCRLTSRIGGSTRFFKGTVASDGPVGDWVIRVAAGRGVWAASGASTGRDTGAHHPQPRGLPRVRKAHAEHDGVVALPRPWRATRPSRSRGSGSSAPPSARCCSPPARSRASTPKARSSAGTSRRSSASSPVARTRARDAPTRGAGFPSFVTVRSTSGFRAGPSPRGGSARAGAAWGLPPHRAGAPSTWGRGLRGWTGDPAPRGPGD